MVEHLTYHEIFHTESSMAISPSDVKALRDRTGAGMADCKKALEETNGDMEAAIEFLRKKGAATAAKRADKAANEGVVATAINEDRTRAAIVEVNCETDFVARNEEFSGFVRRLADHILAAQPSDIDGLMASSMDGKSILDWMNELLGKFNERIELRRFELISTAGGFIADYVHNGDRLGVLIEMSGGSGDDRSTTVARDFAMQVAAMNPGFVRREEVPSTLLDKEREILLQQTVNEGKKPEIAEKIVSGRIEKFFTDACLLEQTFVKDASKTVRDILSELNKEVGALLDVTRFVRYNLGESVGQPAQAEG